MVESLDSKYGFIIPIDQLMCMRSELDRQREFLPYDWGHIQFYGIDRRPNRYPVWFSDAAFCRFSLKWNFTAISFKDAVDLYRE